MKLPAAKILKNYYFISSPLHLLIASNLAAQVPDANGVAIIISKNATQASHYKNALLTVQNIFKDQILLDYPNKQDSMGKRFRLYRKRRAILKGMFANAENKNIYTGNDRRHEFQYAMYISSKNCAETQGIYMDDGAVSYLGHKSLNRIAHNYIDPLLHYILYGPWWRHAKTTGASSWISKLYLAFPGLAHGLLKPKPKEAINSEGFRSNAVLDLTRQLLELLSVNVDEIKAVSVLFVLPAEADFRKNLDTILTCYRDVSARFSPAGIAIKAHPRSTNDQQIKELFQGSHIINKLVGMEMLVPHLKCSAIVIGDVSSALLTTKWLGPHLTVYTLESSAHNQGLSGLFNSLDIYAYEYQENEIIRLASNL